MRGIVSRPISAFTRVFDARYGAATVPASAVEPIDRFQVAAAMA
jgi:hypothetical protein